MDVPDSTRRRSTAERCGNENTKRTKSHVRVRPRCTASEHKFRLVYRLSKSRYLPERRALPRHAYPAQRFFFFFTYFIIQTSRENRSKPNSHRPPFFEERQRNTFVFFLSIINTTNRLLRTQRFSSKSFRFQKHYATI